MDVKRKSTPLRPGMVVRIAAVDDLPEHLFEINEVYDGLITGTALTGPLAGEYGEPDIELVLPVQPNKPLREEPSP